MRRIIFIQSYRRKKNFLIFLIAAIDFLGNPELREIEQAIKNREQEFIEIRVSLIRKFIGI